MKFCIVILNFDFHSITSTRPFVFDCWNYFFYNSNNVLFFVDGFDVLDNHWANLGQFLELHLVDSWPMKDHIPILPEHRLLIWIPSSSRYYNDEHDF